MNRKILKSKKTLVKYSAMKITQLKTGFSDGKSLALSSSLPKYRSTGSSKQKKKTSRQTSNQDPGRVTQSNQGTARFLAEETSKTRSRLSRLMAALTKIVGDFIISIIIGGIFIVLQTRAVVVTFWKIIAITSLYMLEAMVFSMVGQIKLIQVSVQALGYWCGIESSSSEANAKSDRTQNDPGDLLTFGALNGLFWSNCGVSITKELGRLVVGDSKLFDVGSLKDWILKEFEILRPPKFEYKVAVGQVERINIMSAIDKPFQPPPPPPMTTSNNKRPSSLISEERHPDLPLEDSNKQSKVGRLIHRRPRKPYFSRVTSNPLGESDRYNMWYSSKNINGGTMKTDAVGEFFNPVSRSKVTNTLNLIESCGDDYKGPSSAFSPITFGWGKYNNSAIEEQNRNHF
ncbi:hypothetical protein DASC09_024110 [Saccharomycopsis crataegensis]|uniref:Uncharacterized protein n=1 Tax=Saccharomycopsis crataegensis TaxID=43959 RepID=A0AAV5QKE2_9ASCO|nr:hypothetical protein DASC09_024110 [Saccharomycopsis crataegensis]